VYGVLYAYCMYDVYYYNINLYTSHKSAYRIIFDSRNEPIYHKYILYNIYVHTELRGWERTGKLENHICWKFKCRSDTACGTCAVSTYCERIWILNAAGNCAHIPKNDFAVILFISIKCWLAQGPTKLISHCSLKLLYIILLYIIPLALPVINKMYNNPTWRFVFSISSFLYYHIKNGRIGIFCFMIMMNYVPNDNDNNNNFCSFWMTLYFCFVYYYYIQTLKINHHIFYYSLKRIGFIFSLWVIYYLLLNLLGSFSIEKFLLFIITSNFLSIF